MKKNKLSTFWTIVFCAYVLWAIDDGIPKFNETADVYTTWVEERHGQ